MVLRSLSLESLRVFEACARHGNFTRAADELAVTTTAVSQRIRDLEARLGVALFRRHGPRVTLTDAGNVLGAGVREALSGLHKAVADCRATPAPLRVTCTPTFANRWLVAHLADYHRQPGAQAIQLDISVEDRRADAFDVAIRCGRGPSPPLEGMALLPLEGTPMLAPGLASRLTNDPASLQALPVIPDERWQAWFRFAGIAEPALAFCAAEYPTQDAAAVAALHEAGVALLSPTLFEKELREGTLVAPFRHMLEGPDSYWLLWHAGRPATSFARWLTEKLSGLGPSRAGGGLNLFLVPRLS